LRVGGKRGEEKKEGKSLIVLGETAAVHSCRLSALTCRPHAQFQHVDLGGTRLEEEERRKGKKERKEGEELTRERRPTRR